ncbi:MAG: 3-deoxy-D-manno-octulosonic acid transferase [Bacteroidales bacterium]|nr:3-deoxy-D-manno-octulosonic acid transferase [Bacteroidales bacterium]HOY37936.1 glycosyltransferase N-terminal domain-containing protein [Bacteroidales bacterium]HQP03521.1 glycosyltransferase N-terminal domain-containing protein [Bacteroidales bacterium]
MLIVYRIFTGLYFLAVRIAALFNPKAKLMIKGRKNWEALLRKNTDTQHSWIWFHCASLGEFEQGRPLIEKIKQMHPHKKILLSFFSPSGYEMRKNYAYADYVCYLPFDTRKNAAEFFSIIRPEALILVKYELWYYFINKAAESKTKVFLISAIFRKKHWLLRFKTFFAKKILLTFDWIFVQDNQSLQLLQNFECSNCSVEGDTRFDRVIQIVSEPYSNTLIEIFKGNSMCLIAGSTWPADEVILSQTFRSYAGRLKLIVVPHEIHRKHIDDILSLWGKNCLVYSETDNAALGNADVMVIDKMGLLSRLYRYADIAYIGGGFGKGIHNTIEAAAYGVPVFFGPAFRKFNEAVGLIHCGAAFCVHNSTDLTNGIAPFLLNKNAAEIPGKIAADFVFSNKGSVDRIYDKITGFLF